MKSDDLSTLPLDKLVKSIAQEIDKSPTAASGSKKEPTPFDDIFMTMEEYKERNKVLIMLSNQSKKKPTIDSFPEIFPEHLKDIDDDVNSKEECLQAPKAAKILEGLIQLRLKQERIEKKNKVN